MPISLIVTLEMVKFIQAIIISKDKNLMSQESKIYASVQSSNLNEELGQIQYIFSDKTGTLTCNIMDFKNITTNGICFGDARDMKPEFLAERPQVTNVDFKDSSLFDVLSQNSNESHMLLV